MSASASESVTALLLEARKGDADALDALYPLVYDELRRLARVIRRTRGPATLSTTALVHEAYIKLIPSQNLDWQDRTHFFRVAARAMRQVLVNAARARTAQKRGGDQPDITFDERLHGTPVRPSELLDLDAALTRLETQNERQARVVECRFFAGLSVEETALALGVSTPTIKRDWRAARAWLALSLSDE